MKEDSKPKKESEVIRQLFPQLGGPNLAEFPFLERDLLRDRSITNQLDQQYWKELKGQG